MAPKGTYQSELGWQSWLKFPEYFPAKRLASVSYCLICPPSWRRFTGLPLQRPEVWCILGIEHFKLFLWTEFARRGYQTHEYTIGEHWFTAKADKRAGIYANPTNQSQVLEQNLNHASAQISAFQTDWVVVCKRYPGWMWQISFMKLLKCLMHRCMPLLKQMRLFDTLRWSPHNQMSNDIQVFLRPGTM